MEAPWKTTTEYYALYVIMRFVLNAGALSDAGCVRCQNYSRVSQAYQVQQISRVCRTKNLLNLLNLLTKKEALWSSTIL